MQFGDFEYSKNQSQYRSASQKVQKFQIISISDYQSSFESQVQGNKSESSSIITNKKSENNQYQKDDKKGSIQLANIQDLYDDQNSNDPKYNRNHIKIEYNKLKGCNKNLVYDNRFSIVMQDDQTILIEKQIRYINDRKSDSVWTYLLENQQIQYTPKVIDVKCQNNNKKHVKLVVQEVGIADFSKIKQLMKQFETQKENVQQIKWEFIKLSFDQLYYKLNLMYKDNLAHGDIKPQNMIITLSGQCYFIDFDSAVKIHESQQDCLNDYFSFYTPNYNHPKVLEDLKNKQVSLLFQNKLAIFLIDRLQFFLSFISLICDSSQTDYLFNKKHINQIQHLIFQNDFINEYNKQFIEQLFQEYNYCENILLSYIKDKNPKAIQEYLDQKVIKMEILDLLQDISNNKFTQYLIGFQINNERKTIKVNQLYRITSIFLNQQKKEIEFDDNLEINETIRIQELPIVYDRLKKQSRNKQKGSILYYFNKQHEEKIEYQIENEWQLNQFIQSLYLQISIQILNVFIQKDNQLPPILINKLIDTIQYTPSLKDLTLSFINQELDLFTKHLNLLFSKVETLKLVCSIINEDKHIQQIEQQNNTYVLKNLNLQILSSQIKDKQLQQIASLLSMTQLQELQFVIRNSSEITDEGITCLLLELSKIKELQKLNLDISLCPNLQKQTVNSLIKFLNVDYYLQEITINIQGCQGIQAGQFNNILDNILSKNIINYQLKLYYQLLSKDNSIINKIGQINTKFNNKIQIIEQQFPDHFIKNNQKKIFE